MGPRVAVGWRLESNGSAGWLFGRVERVRWLLELDTLELVCDYTPEGWSGPLDGTPVSGLKVCRDGKGAMPYRDWLEENKLVPPVPPRLKVGLNEGHKGEDGNRCRKQVAAPVGAARRKAA